MTMSVDCEATEEAATVVGLALVETLAGKAPESTTLKRAAAGKTRRTVQIFILSVMCGFLTGRG